VRGRKTVGSGGWRERRSHKEIQAKATHEGCWLEGTGGGKGMDQHQHGEVATQMEEEKDIEATWHTAGQFHQRVAHQGKNQ